MKEFAKPHSKLGIASCVVGLITSLIFLMAVAFWLTGSRCPVCSEEVETKMLVLSLSILLLLPLPAHFVGFTLGAVSLFFPNRRKLFPVIGVVFNLIFGMIGSFPILLGIALAA